VDALLQARRREGEEADGRRRPGTGLQREARRDPDLSHHGVGGAGGRRAAQAHRHHRRDRERGVRGLDQALAGQGLRPDDEHHAALRLRGRLARQGVMGRYLLVRLYSMAVTLLGLTVLTFLMLRLIPGTVVEQMIGADAIVSEAMVAQLKAFFGLDQPWYVQYGRWMGSLLQGDLGTSWRTGKPVVQLIGERLP